MQKFLRNIGNILPLAKNSIIPSVILAVVLVVFYAYESFAFPMLQNIHIMIFLLAFINLGILIYFNINKPVMIILISMLSYIAINLLKSLYGKDYAVSAYYINMINIVPINILIFYLMPQQKLFSRITIYQLIAIFVQIAIIEQTARKGIVLNYSFFYPIANNLTNISLMLFVGVTITTLLFSSYNGRIIDTYITFALIEMMFGYIYSDNPTALTMFFFASLLTIVIGLGYDIYYAIHKDVLTELLSRNSFVMNSKNFPIKYTIGIVSIDDYERLEKIFKRYELNALTIMVASKIKEIVGEHIIYRYDRDEFVIIYKNENIKFAFENIETIRRAIAAAEFVLSKRKRTIKLTVSCSISEKKRSDSNAFEVLFRASKALEQTNKFSQNITTKA